jgi:hypothetical protein
MKSTRLVVTKSNIGISKTLETDLPEIGKGEVLAKTGNFALTANNISYAVSGDQLGYWKYFPVDSEWGIVPVWGFAEIIASECDQIPIGTRFWGFLPMASHFILKPIRVKSDAFVDGAQHRLDLHGVYNRYQITNGDSEQLTALADARSLLFPLFFTGYVIADYIEDNECFGAAQVVIGSASSKTGFSVAYYLARLLGKKLRVTGLTSNGNFEFTNSLGFYDTVLGYKDVLALDASKPTIFVDMSGDGELLSSLHNHFGDNMKASILVGVTHWEATRNQAKLPGAKPSFFFAPNQIQKREKDWGPGVLSRRVEEANIELIAKISDKLEITRQNGATSVQSSFTQMVRGEVPPNNGLILSF